MTALNLFSDKYLFFRKSTPMSGVTKCLLLNVSLDHLKYQTGEYTERSILFFLGTVYPSGMKCRELSTVSQSNLKCNQNLGRYVSSPQTKIKP